MERERIGGNILLLPINITLCLLLCGEGNVLRLSFNVTSGLKFDGGGDILLLWINPCALKPIYCLNLVSGHAYRGDHQKNTSMEK